MCVAATCCVLVMNRMARSVRARCSVQSSGKGSHLDFAAVLNSVGPRQKQVDTQDGQEERAVSQVGTQVRVRSKTMELRKLVLDASPRTAHRTTRVNHCMHCTRSIQKRGARALGPFHSSTRLPSPRRALPRQTHSLLALSSHPPIIRCPLSSPSSSSTSSSPLPTLASLSIRRPSFAL